MFLSLLGRVWYLNISIPDFCLLSYFEESWNQIGLIGSGNQVNSRQSEQGWMESSRKGVSFVDGNMRGTRGETGGQDPPP